MKNMQFKRYPRIRYIAKACISGYMAKAADIGILIVYCHVVRFVENTAP